MNLNTNTTPHYRSQIIDIENLKTKIFLNANYLKEKPTWYEIDNRLQYFKVRSDLRIFTELFFSCFASRVMDFETLDYNIAYVRTVSSDLKKSEEVSKCGLLSDNFQNKGFNHYLVSELQKPEISNFVAYGGYNLSSLLSFFKDTLSSASYRVSESFLLKLFMIDGFTFQVDRNPHNISFQIPRLPGISYKERLHINKLIDNPLAENTLEFDSERGIFLLKDFVPNVVYDSERSLGIDHKNVRTYNHDQCWYPEFPYTEELRFSNGLEAKIISQKEFDGVDPNLLSVFIDYHDFCQPYFERLAYDDEYRKILEDFTAPTSPIQLEDKEVEYFRGIMEDRQTEFQKVLKL